MMSHFQFKLEQRKRGARLWWDTSHSTSHWPTAPLMLEEQARLYPDQEFRIVGEIKTVDQDGSPIKSP